MSILIKDVSKSFGSFTALVHKVEAQRSIGQLVGFEQPLWKLGERHSKARGAAWRQNGQPGARKSVLHRFIQIDRVLPDMGKGGEDRGQVRSI